MVSISNPLPQELFWTGNLLDIILATALLLLTWWLLSVPASSLAAYLDSTHSQLQRYKDQFLSKHEQVLGRYRDEIREKLRASYRNHSFVHVHSSNHVLWKASLSRAISQVDELTRRIKQSHSDLAAVYRTLSDTTDQMRRMDIQLPPWPALPDTKDLYIELKEVRQARAALAVVAVLLFLTIAANAFMLSGVLKFLEIEAKVFDFNVHYVLAIIITLAEAGVGVAHAYLSAEKAGQHPSRFLGQVVLVLLAIFLSVVEGSFYAFLGDEQLAAFAPGVQALIATKLDLRIVFFLWGFSLPIILAFLGHFSYRSLMRVRADHTLREMRKQIRGVEALAEKLETRFREVMGKRIDTQKTTATAVQLLGGYDAQGRGKVEEQLAALQEYFEGMREAVPDWARPSLSPLTEAESRAQAFRALAALSLTIGAVAISSWLTADILGDAFGDRLAVALGIGQALAFLVCGYLLRPKPMVTTGGQVLQPVEGFRGWFEGFLASLVTVALLGSFGLMAWGLPLASHVPLLVIVALGITLFALGHDLPASLSLALTAIRAFLTLAKMFSALVTRWALHLLCGALLVGEFLAGLIALPRNWLSRRQIALRSPN